MRAQRARSKGASSAAARFCASSAAAAVVMLMRLIRSALKGRASARFCFCCARASAAARFCASSAAAVPTLRVWQSAAVPTRASASGMAERSSAYPRLCFGLPTLRVWQAARQLALIVPRRVRASALLLLLLARFCGHSSTLRAGSESRRAPFERA